MPTYNDDSFDDDFDTSSKSKNRQLTTGESGAKFAALKKEFLFHEKRMQLLLSSSVIEGLSAAITEKLTTRDECADDCQKTLKQLSDVSQMPTLTGRWNESVVASVLQLNIPLRDVVGSQLYEATETGEVEDLKDYIRQLALQAEEHQEFKAKKENAENNRAQNNHGLDPPKMRTTTTTASTGEANSSPSSSNTKNHLLQNLLESINPNALSTRDVKRMKDAVFSKLQVIAELSHLSDALQKSGFQLAQVRSEVCQLQEQEDMANNDGEVAISETLVQRRIENLEKIIDIIFFRLHTVDATIDTNVTKRHSNLQALQHTTVALEGIKREKDDVVQTCTDDIRRIDRSLQLQQVKEQTDSKGAELVAESQQKLAAIDEKRVALSERLKSLGAEFIETERALAKLGVERAIAIDRHLDIVEQSRGAAADFAEMSRFATAHRKNLELTRERATEGLDSVVLLERLLLQETDYMQYNFRASATRLQNVRENVALELKSALRDYEISIGEMLRRKQEMVLQLDEQIHVAECEAELRKDIFDPAAKKFVEKLRKLEENRSKLVAEMCVLSEKLGQQISSIKNRLGEEFVNDAVGFGGNNNNNNKNQKQDNNNNPSGKSLTLGSGATFSSTSSNETKRMVTNLREKVAKEMTLLQLEQARADEQSKASLDKTQRQLRDVVDGVSRIAEDDELQRRNLRKHERLLDQRQELLDRNNRQVSTLEERREIAALAQRVESTVGLHHQQVLEEFKKKEHVENLRRRGLLLPSSNDVTREKIDRDDEDEDYDDNDRNTKNYYAKTPEPTYNNNNSSINSRPLSSNARALSIRDEIRRAKQNSSLLRVGSPEKNNTNNNNNNQTRVNNNNFSNSQLKGYQLSSSQNNIRERGVLEQVDFVEKKSKPTPYQYQQQQSNRNQDHGDDDVNEDDLFAGRYDQPQRERNREQNESFYLQQGSGVRAAKNNNNRNHPRVIGSTRID